MRLRRCIGCERGSLVYTLLRESAGKFNVGCRDVSVQGKCTKFRHFNMIILGKVRGGWMVVEVLRISRLFFGMYSILAPLCSI